MLKSTGANTEQHNSNIVIQVEPSLPCCKYGFMQFFSKPIWLHSKGLFSGFCIMEVDVELAVLIKT